MPDFPVHIVWYKRDLRLHDHAPLAAAARAGAVLPLYIVEPSVMHAPDFDPCQWTFIRACLGELRAGLAALGQPLVVRVGEAVPVLEHLRQTLPIAGLWAHEETGGALTYARDRAVIRWARQAGIPFTELPQTGVVRRLRDRDGWTAAFEAHMRAPQVTAPERLVPLADVPVGQIPAADDLGLPPDPRRLAQPGGETAARNLLHTFLTERGRHYQRAMSSPISAASACSRLSPHLAWGSISPRTAFQAAHRRVAEARALGEAGWAAAANAFAERLWWRGHFMQKLEDEPEIETRSFIPAYDDLRAGYDPALLEAWTHGMTGYPLVDACMRSLMVTGWLNFRMRAMVVSFGAYDLWLPWQKLALARPCVWVDFEPGIHYSQFQMQSGTTGINTLRIYNPVKQSLDHDPHGAFIRRFVPELAPVPDSFIHQPWLMPGQMQAQVGVRIGRGYPAPVVDHEEAARAAKQRVWALRSQPDIAAAAAEVRRRHGSRRPVRQRRRVSREQEAREKGGQLRLF
jgi:deoxyribodipyrimidine photo-lyase